MKSAIRRYLTQTATFSFVLSSCCGIVVAQSEQCIHRTIIASLTNRDWAPITGVRREDFVGEFRGKPVQLLSLTPDEGPRRIVILLDASGSQAEAQTGPAPWYLGVALASHIVEAKLEHTELALIIFNERIIEVLDFDSGRAKLAERLRQIGADPNYKKLNVKGKTALWDAADEALGRLGRSNETREIYAITDGEDNASRTKEKELHQRLAESRTRMFATILQAPIPQNRGRTPEELKGPQALEEMVTQSGGVVFGPVLQTHNGVQFGGLDTSRELKLTDALTNFYRSMQSGFRVEIEIPQPPNRWSSWNLDLSKPAKNRFKSYQLGFTSEISPCLAHSD